jgi:hypothetical protein
MLAGTLVIFSVLTGRCVNSCAEALVGSMMASTAILTICICRNLLHAWAAILQGRQVGSSTAEDYGV